MTTPSVIIIGAGIGGLATGCYAQMNDFDTRVFEMHTGPGGVCTSWTRSGYVFDGCIHNLAGSSPQSAFFPLWRELGVVPARTMYAYPELVRIERPDGEALTVHSNIDHLEEHLRRLAPGDGPRIAEITRAARRFMYFDFLGLAMASRGERLRAVTKLPLLFKWSRITLEQFAKGLRDPFLRRAFPMILYDWPQQPMSFLLAFLAGVHKGDLGWPIGGSGAFSETLAQRYEALGGKIRYEARVESILVENDRAVGVRLADGSEHRADIVVSNAYGPTTIFDMLGGRYVSRAIRQFYSAPVDRVEMGIHISLGIARDLSSEPHAIVWPLERSVIIAGEVRDRFYIEPFGFDKSLAPEGKSVLKVVMATRYRHWERLSQEPARYREEKDRISATVVELLTKRFPGLHQQVEAIDVATPITTARLTGNKQGFQADGAMMARTLFTGKRLSQTLPGLKNFYMVGQWAGLAGVPLVAAMGRDVARAICRHYNRPFNVR